MFDRSLLADFALSTSQFMPTIPPQVAADLSRPPARLDVLRADVLSAITYE